MQDYAAQVPVADRWAIAAYIRALQLSPARRAIDGRAGRSAAPISTPLAPPRQALHRSREARAPRRRPTWT